MPPYHPDLQPIELTWGFVKGHVARKFSGTRNMSELKEHVQEAFDQLTRQFIAGQIAHSRKEELK